MNLLNKSVQPPMAAKATVPPVPLVEGISKFLNDSANLRFKRNFLKEITDFNLFKIKKILNIFKGDLKRYEVDVGIKFHENIEIILVDFLIQKRIDNAASRIEFNNYGTRSYPQKKGQKTFYESNLVLRLEDGTLETLIRTYGHAERMPKKSSARILVEDRIWLNNDLIDYMADKGIDLRKNVIFDKSTNMFELAIPDTIH